MKIYLVTTTMVAGNTVEKSSAVALRTRTEAEKVIERLRKDDTEKTQLAIKWKYGIEEIELVDEAYYI